MFLWISLVLMLVCSSLEAETIYVTFAQVDTVKRFLFKMDPLGRVTAGAFHLRGLDGGPLRNKGGSALGHHSSSTLNYWTVGRNGVIFRAVIDKNTGHVLKVFRTRRTTQNRLTLQVTQRMPSNFLIFQSNRPDGMEHVMGVRLSPSGAFTNDVWEISVPGITDFPSFVGLCSDNCGGYIPADGKLAIMLDRNEKAFWRLFFQRLNSEGRPRERPKLLLTLRPEKAGIFGVDITSELPDQRRFLVYIKRLRSNGSDETFQLLLQPLDGRTGDKIGGAITLISGDILPRQSLAIDPKGRFVLFEIIDDLYFLALDATGRPSGSPKLLVRDVLDSVDILIEQEIPDVEEH